MIWFALREFICPSTFETAGGFCSIKLFLDLRSMSWEFELFSVTWFAAIADSITNSSEQFISSFVDLTGFAQIAVFGTNLLPLRPWILVGSRGTGFFRKMNGSILMSLFISGICAGFRASFAVIFRCVPCAFTTSLSVFMWIIIVFFQSSAIGFRWQRLLLCEVFIGVMPFRSVFVVSLLFLLVICPVWIFSIEISHTFGFKSITIFELYEVNLEDLEFHFYCFRYQFLIYLAKH